MFESLLFKLEVLDHKAREGAGLLTATLGSPIPVLLRFETALETLQSLNVKYTILESVYELERKANTVAKAYFATFAASFSR